MSPDAYVVELHKFPTVEQFRQIRNLCERNGGSPLLAAPDAPSRFTSYNGYAWHAALLGDTVVGYVLRNVRTQETVDACFEPHAQHMAGKLHAMRPKEPTSLNT